MTEQTQEQTRVPSNILMDKLVELSEGIVEPGSFYARITHNLSELVNLRLHFIQHYREYSSIERNEFKDLFELVSGLYDDRMQLSRIVDYREILAGPKGKSGS